MGIHDGEAGVIIRRFLISSYRWESGSKLHALHTLRDFGRGSDSALDAMASNVAAGRGAWVFYAGIDRGRVVWKFKIKNGPMVNRRAFTFVELMTVMAIISILAALLLPRLSRATEKARGTTCLNNMHQVGIASAMYTEEYRDFIVPIGSRVSSLPEDRLVPYQSYLWWPDILRPYTKAGPKLFSCPSVFPTQAGVLLTNLLGIGMNYNELGVISGGRARPRDSYVSLSSVKIPSETVIFADSAYVDNPYEQNADLWVAAVNRTNYWKGFGVWIFETPSAANDQWNLNPVRVFNRHDGLANCEFLDGHIEQDKSSAIGWQYPRGDSRAKWDR